MSDMSQTPSDLSTPDERREALLRKPTVVLGAGPAGLTAGYLLAKRGLPVIVLEAEDQVGGLAKTEERDGYRFDLGGHRFFTKARRSTTSGTRCMRRGVPAAAAACRASTGTGKFLDYPLRGPDVIRKLGPVELTRVVRLLPVARPSSRRASEDSLEEWVSNRFGRRLFNLFFKSYTEKVWGVPTSEIRAEWAAQRIKGLSFFSAAKAAFFGNKGNKVKSLISEFHYPRFGPGQMWEAMTAEIRRLGGEVRLETAGRASSWSRTAASWRCRPAARRSSPASDLVAAAARDRGHDAARSRRPRRARRPAGCATATSSRWPWSSTARTSSRTTGSTSTSPTCRSAGSRTTAPGARGWCPTRPRRASGSSTSASRATSCGR